MLKSMPYGTVRAVCVSSASTTPIMSFNPSSPAPLDLSTLVLPDEPQGPFPAPSEPLQYRAIGIVRGRYEPSEERITQGTLYTSDGVAIDAVLLGRVLSLVRKHLDLGVEHPWVVYPRTREGGGLHTQIVGVWSLNPDGLKAVEREGDEQSADSEDEALDEEELDEDDELDTDEELDEDDELDAQDETADSSEEAESEASREADSDSGNGNEAQQTLLFSTENLEGVDGFFSIRGEVSFQSYQEGFVLIKIRQQGKKRKPGRAFKLRLEGSLPDNSRGQFWDLEVRRTGATLDILSGTSIATLPRLPDKRRPGGGGGRPGGPRGGGGGRSGGGFRPRPNGDRGENRGLVRPDRTDRPFRPIDRQPRPPAE